MSYRAGFCGLIGLPNAGKSSLTNFLVGEKISIVTSKPQTTRQRIVALWSDDAGQIALVDAPGFLKNSQGLNLFLENEAQQVIKDSDILVAVINLDEEKKENLDEILALVEASKKPYVVVITKTDLRKYEHRLARLRQELVASNRKVFELSLKADLKDADKLKNIRTTLRDLLPESPAPLFDPEFISPLETRELVAEMVREKCFENLHQEIPYGIAIRIIKFEESEKITKISADILVAKEAHKPMVIGQKAQVIKKIGMEARPDIEKFLDKKVFLELNVVVRPEWTHNSGIMKELGYDIKRD